MQKSRVRILILLLLLLAGLCVMFAVGAMQHDALPSGDTTFVLAEGFGHG